LRSGEQRLVLSDLLCGEVWVASGQSNMEWTLANSVGPSVEAVKKPHPQVRLLNVPLIVGGQGDPYAGLSWTLATPETQPNFSAVAFHFAESLSKKLGVPVGIINASWSGTNGEAWTPLSAIEAEPKLAPVLSRFKALPDAHKHMYTDGWSFWLEFRQIRLLLADGSTRSVVPARWSAAGGEGSRSEASPNSYRGLLPPGAWAASKGQLTDDGSTVDWSKVQAISFQAKGNSTFDLALAQASIADGDQPCSAAFDTTGEWKDYRFDLATFKQQGWGQPKPRDLSQLTALQFRVHSPNQFPDQPGILFDSMIAPLAGFELAGALWYQGESNVGRYQEYEHLLKALVRGWRGVLGQELKFVVVQLPEYEDPLGTPGDWDRLRAVQKTVLSLPGTAVVDTKGLGQPHDVHPRLKQPVGERAAAQAAGL
jgi:sialate O-acetylesterase